MSQSSTRIYTKTGDDGTTGRLFGGRVGKDGLVIEACGDIDETVSALGVAREALDAEPDAGQRAAAALVLTLQRHLFVVAADLMANPRARDRLVPGISLVGPEMTDEIERTIDRLTADRPLRAVFVVPGASRAGAALDLARAVARRAERHVIRSRSAGDAVSTEVVAYLNRLGDLLYVMARHAAGADEEPASHV